MIAGKGSEICDIPEFAVDGQDGRLRQSLRRRYIRDIRIPSCESMTCRVTHLDRVCFQLDNDMSRLSDVPREQYAYPILMLI